MEAPLFYRAAALAGMGLLSLVSTLSAATARSANFVVEAPSEAIAQQVAQAAEQYRQDLAVHWLGEPLPGNWAKPCPIQVKVGAGLGAGGATSFLFDRGEVYGWKMNIQGSLERVLDSVLPHEVTHTIFASHFRQPLPRWADEGACSTVEHHSERTNHQRHLQEFLQTGRGIAFNRMFQMKDYPSDVMPLYAQGHSVVTFLLQRGGQKEFIAFLADGLKRDEWVSSVRSHYNFPSLAALQDAWLDWVRDGSPEGPSTTPAPLDMDSLLAQGTAPSRNPTAIYRGQSQDNGSPARGRSPRTSEDAAAPNELASNGPSVSPASGSRPWAPLSRLRNAIEKTVRPRRDWTPVAGAAAKPAARAKPSRSADPFAVREDADETSPPEASTADVAARDADAARAPAAATPAARTAARGSVYGASRLRRPATAEPQAEADAPQEPEQRTASPPANGRGQVLLDWQRPATANTAANPQGTRRAPVYDASAGQTLRR